MFGEIYRQRPCEGDDCALGGCINTHPRRTRCRLHRGEIDDRTAATFDHLRNASMAGEIHGFQVDCQRSIPSRFVGCNHVTNRMDGRRVDQDVEPPN